MKKEIIAVKNSLDVHSAPQRVDYIKQSEIM